MEIMSDKLKRKIIDKITNYFPDAVIASNSFSVLSDDGKNWFTIDVYKEGEPLIFGQVDFSYYWLYTYTGNKDYSYTTEVCCPFEDKSEEESVYLNMTGDYGLFLNRKEFLVKLDEVLKDFKDNYYE
jgi:hypothetical protein